MSPSLILIILLILISRSDSRAVDVSTNKSFMLNNGTGSTTNNRLPPSETNFFSVNKDLLTNAVSSVIGGAGAPGVSLLGAASTVMVRDPNGIEADTNNLSATIAGNIFPSNTFNSSNVYVGKTNFAMVVAVSNRITFPGFGEQIGDDAAGNLSIFNPFGDVNIGGSSFGASDGTINANLINAAVPVTDLNNGTDADADHAWFGDGTWKIPSGGGGGSSPAFGPSFQSVGGVTSLVVGVTTTNQQAINITLSGITTNLAGTNVGPSFTNYYGATGITNVLFGHTNYYVGGVLSQTNATGSSSMDCTAFAFTNGANYIVWNGATGTLTVDGVTTINGSGITTSTLIASTAIIGNIQGASNYPATSLLNFFDTNNFISANAYDGAGNVYSGTTANYTNFQPNVLLTNVLCRGYSNSLCFSNFQGLSVSNTSIFWLQLHQVPDPGGAGHVYYLSFAGVPASSLLGGLYQGYPLATATEIVIQCIIPGTNWQGSNAMYILQPAGGFTVPGPTTTTIYGPSGILMHVASGFPNFVIQPDSGFGVQIKGYENDFIGTQWSLQAQGSSISGNNGGGWQLTGKNFSFTSPNTQMTGLSNLSVQYITTSSNGFASYATNTVSIPSTGWTNITTNTYRLFNLAGTSMTFSNSASPSFINFSLGTIATGANMFLLNPNESITGTGITVSKAIAQ